MADIPLALAAFFDDTGEWFNEMSFCAPILRQFDPFLGSFWGHTNAKTDQARWDPDLVNSDPEVFRVSTQDVILRGTPSSRGQIVH